MLLIYIFIKCSRLTYSNSGSELNLLNLFTYLWSVQFKKYTHKSSVLNKKITNPLTVIFKYITRGHDNPFT